MYSALIAALTAINLQPYSELLTIQLLLQSTPHWKVNWIEVLTIRWPVFWVDKLWYYGGVWKCRWSALWRIARKMPQLNIMAKCTAWGQRCADSNCANLTPPHLQRIFNHCAKIKLLILWHSCSPRKMLQLDIWQIAVRHFLPKLFTVDYPKCV